VVTPVWICKISEAACPGEKPSHAAAVISVCVTVLAPEVSFFQACLDLKQRQCHREQSPRHTSRHHIKKSTHTDLQSEINWIAAESKEPARDED
jgi:hypothetical protein